MLPPLPPGAAAPGLPPGPMQGMPMGGGLPMLPPPMPMDSVPAMQAGQAAASLVPAQLAAQAQLEQQQQQETIAALMQVFQSAPNPAAEAAGSMPAPMVTPDSGVPVDDPNNPNGGMF